MLLLLFGGSAATARIYYVVYPSALSAPSAAQVKAGQDSNGDAATASGDEASPETSQTYTFSTAATGLTAATSYRIAFVWSDGTDNSNVAVSDAFVTLNATQTISVTHVALGTVRVMRTTGMMGEVVGMAASLCTKHAATPRGVYEKHLDQLKALMEHGVGKPVFAP